MELSIQTCKLEALRREAIDTYQKLLKKGAYELFNSLGQNQLLDDLMESHSLLNTIKHEVSKLPSYRMVTINFSEDKESDAVYVYEHFHKILQKKWVSQSRSLF